MRIDLALLGDYAIADKMDKLTVAGIFRAVLGTSFPLVRPVMFLALTATAEAGDGSDHHITVRLIDPDGREVMSEIHGDMQISRTDPTSETSVNIVLELTGVTFAGPGPHSFDILVDGRFAERVPLEVALLKLTAPAG